MRAIDGKITIRAREDAERWPENARCDLSIVSVRGASAAVFMTESDVRTLISRLTEQLDPPRTVLADGTANSQATPEEHP